jgi:uncharacterized protein
MTPLMKGLGYNQEELYFHEHDLEKIETIRELRAETKKALEKETHWMKCPKCGNEMEEIDIEHILLEKCSHCKGLYFDQGELDLLMGHRNKTTFVEKLSHFLK